MERKEKQEKKGLRHKLKGNLLLIMLVAVLLVVVFLVMFFFTMFVDVSTGHAVMLIDNTKPSGSRISDPILGPAWIIKAPWIGVVDVYYSTDVYEDVIPCFSSDQLEMAITVQMRWQLSPDKIRSLYQSYPNLNYETSAIDSIMEEEIRFVTKNYTALETIQYRETIAFSMQDNVFAKVQEEPSLMNALTYLKFDLKNIGYPTNYTKAVEDKLVKEQLKLGASFEQERIVILANASAQEVLIKASAEATAKVIVANSTKEAIQMILEASGADPTNATRIAELYLWVETLKQIAPNIQTFIMVNGADGIPIMIPVNP